MEFSEAIPVLAALAGQHRWDEAPPRGAGPIFDARSSVPREIRDFITSLKAAGRSIPRQRPDEDPADFEDRFWFRTAHDMPVWRAGILSGAQLRMPESITPELTQATADQLGYDKPRKTKSREIGFDQISFHQRLHIFDRATHFPVFLQVNGRGPNLPLDVPGGGAIDLYTVRMANWALGDGYIPIPIPRVVAIGGAPLGEYVPHHFGPARNIP